MDFSVKTTMKRPGVFVVAPAGAIDARSQAAFEKAVEPVLARRPEVVIFDMAAADYINSSGIRVLLKAKQALGRHGGRQVFVHLQPQIRKVFDILNALPSLRVFASIQELDRYLDAMQQQEGG